jgi:hypothetical protein
MPNIGYVRKTREFFALEAPWRKGFIPAKELVLANDIMNYIRIYIDTFFWLSLNRFVRGTTFACKWSNSSDPPQALRFGQHPNGKSG